MAEKHGRVQPITGAVRGVGFDVLAFGINGTPLRNVFEDLRRDPADAFVQDRDDDAIIGFNHVKRRNLRGSHGLERDRDALANPDAHGGKRPLGFTF